MATTTKRVGRPSLPATNKRQVQVNSRMTFDTYAKLATMAVQAGTTKSDMIRQLVEREYVRE